MRRDPFKDIYEEAGEGRRYKAYALGKWILGPSEQKVFSPIDNTIIGTIPRRI